MVSKPRKWALGSNEYVKRLADGSAIKQSEGAGTSPEDVPPSVSLGSIEFEQTGISWDPFDVDKIKSSTVDRARYRFRSHLPELIWNTAALEGNNFTLPEVKTLLDGVTVGGQRLEDEKQILALSEAYNRLDELVGVGEFALTKAVSDELHGLVAVHEAIEAGHFRGEGQVQGGGSVSLANGGSVAGPQHGEGGVLLRRHFDELIDYLATESDSRRRALIYFASATRWQFYFDGNKRTARMMMTGELMSSGFDVVSIPFSRKLEFNLALDRLFELDDATELLRFLADCSLDDA